MITPFNNRVVDYLFGKPAPVHNTADAPGAPLGAAWGGDAASFAQALPGGTVMPDGDVRWTKVSLFGGHSRPFGTVGPDGRLHSGGYVGSLSSDGTVHWQVDPCWLAVYDGKGRRPSDEDDSPAATFARGLESEILPDGDVWFRTSYNHGGPTDKVGTVGSDGRLHCSNGWVGKYVGYNPAGPDVNFEDDPCSHEEP